MGIFISLTPIINLIIGGMYMKSKLSTMHGNKRVFIERTTLNLLYVEILIKLKNTNNK